VSPPRPTAYPPRPPLPPGEGGAGGPAAGEPGLLYSPPEGFSPYEAAVIINTWGDGAVYHCGRWPRIGDGPLTTAFAPAEAPLALPAAGATADALGAAPLPAQYFVRSHETVYRLYYAALLWDDLRRAGPISDPATARGWLVRLVVGRPPAGFMPGHGLTGASRSLAASALHAAIVRDGITTLTLHDAISVRPTTGAGILVPVAAPRVLRDADYASYRPGPADAAAPADPPPAGGPPLRRRRGRPPAGALDADAGALAPPAASASPRRMLRRLAGDATSLAEDMSTAADAELPAQLAAFADLCAEWMRLLSQSLSPASLQ